MGGQENNTELMPKQIDGLSIRRTNIFERNRRKTLVLLVLVVTFVADLSVTNIAKRLFPNLENDEKRYRTHSTIYHHDLVPLVHTRRAHWGHRYYVVATNSLGFKDAACRDIKLVPENYRMLFMGDSFTEGIGCAYEETFVGRIDLKLRESGVEVLNGAVSDYCPIVYLVKVGHLLEKGLRFDELVVCIDISDIEDDVYLYMMDDATQRLVEGPGAPQPEVGVNRRFKDFIKANTVVTRALLYAIRDTAGVELAVPVDKFRAAWTYDDEALERYGKLGLEKATGHMDQLAALLSTYGIKLTVVVYPWPNQIFQRDKDSLQIRHWRAWSTRNSAGFIDLFPYFIDDRDAEQVIRDHFIPGDIHWNQKGHEVVARGFLENFEQRK